MKDALAAVFAQDQLTLLRDKLELIVGAQLSHGGFAGFQIQPTARLLWTPTAKLSSWVAISRAVRTPSIYERFFEGIATAEPIAAPIICLGTPDRRSELPI